GEEGLEQILRLGFDARAGILHRHESLASLILRPDRELAKTIVDERHGLDRVDNEVDDHLLQFYTVAQNHRQIARKVERERYVMIGDLALHEGERFLDHRVDMKGRLLRLALLGELAQVPNDIARASCIL